MARKPLALIVAAIVAVGALLWVVTDGSDKPKAKSQAANAASRGSGHTTLRPLVTVPTTPPSSEPAPEAQDEPGDELDNSPEEIWRSINMISVDSGLPPAVIQDLTTKSMALVVADLTGRGRGAFPGYWGPDSPESFRPQYDQVQPKAAGVSLTGEPNLVQILVGYSALRIEADGKKTQYPVKRTFVYFFQEGNVWKPVHITG